MPNTLALQASLEEVGRLIRDAEVATAAAVASARLLSNPEVLAATKRADLAVRRVHISAWTEVNMHATSLKVNVTPLSGGTPKDQ